MCTINHGEENNLVVFVHHMRHTLSPNDSFDKLVSACVRENFSNILTFTLSASCPTPVSGIYYQHNLENKYVPIDLPSKRNQIFISQHCLQLP